MPYSKNQIQDGTEVMPLKSGNQIQDGTEIVIALR